jgi:hypothetical protein
MDDNGAGHLAGAMATHPVRYGKKSAAGLAVELRRRKSVVQTPCYTSRGPI